MDYIIGGITTLFLFAYLIYALLKPEKVSRTMTSNGILQIVVYFLIILALTKPMGAFMAKLFEGGRTFLHPVIRPTGTADVQIGRRKRTDGAALDPVHRLRCSPSVSSAFLFVYCLQRLAGMCCH